MKDVERIPSPCPDPELLAVYLDGKLTSAERALVEEHLLSCRKCRKTIAGAIRSEESVTFPSKPDQS